MSVHFFAGRVAGRRGLTVKKSCEFFRLIGCKSVILEGLLPNSGEHILLEL